MESRSRKRKGGEEGDDASRGGESSMGYANAPSTGPDAPSPCDAVLDRRAYLMLGDCHVRIGHVPSNSVQMVYFDPPYGITRHSWDTPLDMTRLWPEIWRVLKSDGVVVVHTSVPFTIDFLNTQRKFFKYWWVWHKSRKTNFLNSKRQPLRNCEEICVFYKKQCKYFPQMTDEDTRVVTKDNGTVPSKGVNPYGHVSREYRGYFPCQYLYFPEAQSTMKPEELSRYLIRTYTEEDDVVFDLTMHTGIFGVAAMHERRTFFGIEKERRFFDKAERAMRDVSATGTSEQPTRMM